MSEVEAGDAALHKPSGETWFVIGVNKSADQVCAAGWPATIGRLSDCVLVTKGNGLTTDEVEHRQETFGGGWDPHRLADVMEIRE